MRKKKKEGTSGYQKKPIRFVWMRTNYNQDLGNGYFGKKIDQLEKLSFYLQVATINQVIKYF